MKKLLCIALTTFLSTLATMASASPIAMDITVQCPMVMNQSSMLSNYGDYIAGYGVERIKDQGDYAIYFKSNASVKDVPVNLDHYANAGTKYNSTNGEVTCTYLSSTNEPSFDIVYPLTNAHGGKVISSVADKINVLIPFAFKG